MSKCLSIFFSLSPRNSASSLRFSALQLFITRRFTEKTRSYAEEVLNGLFHDNSKAIIAGEREPVKLCRHVHGRTQNKHGKQVITKVVPWEKIHCSCQADEIAKSADCHYTRRYLQTLMLFYDLIKIIQKFNTLFL